MDTSRPRLALSALVAVACLAACSTPRAAATEETPFVVHEWGTFLAFEGADGVAMEGMQHEAEHLPEFVHSPIPTLPSPFAPYGDGSRTTPVQGCRNKMETPVLYFHSKSDRRVRVHVGYRGLLTHWYPDGASTTPTLPSYGLASVGSTSLDWDLDVLAEGGVVPSVPPTSLWQKAREVDAATVRDRRTGETERYVFYRGVSAEIPRVHVRARRGAWVLLENDGPRVTEGFLIEIREGRGRVVSVQDVDPSIPRTVDLSEAPWLDAQATTTALELAMGAALMRAGLYADEARAMVRTWSETWFQLEGTRFVHVVPRAVVDDALPIHVDPTPTALERVLVDRVEYLTPEREDELLLDLQRWLGGTAAEKEAALRRMARLGRFLEPALRSVAARTDSAAARAAATLLVAQLR